MHRLLMTLGATALLAATGCADDRAGAGSGGEPRVVAAFYPLEFVAGEIAGDDAQVTNLSPPGVEPHDLELAPGQVRAMGQAELVVYVGEGFQPAVEDVVGELADTQVLDALESQDALLEEDHSNEEEHAEDEDHDDGPGEETGDPHVWLDPTRLAAIGDSVAAEMAEIDPDHAASYRDHAETLTARLHELDREYRSVLENCERDELVVSHEAFGYLTDRYGLEQIGVSALDPEAEPSPGRLAEVAAYAEEHGVTTIFFEEQVSPDIARVIADEVGAVTEVLDPLEFPPDDGSDYFDVMRTNLGAISAALDCG
ncbi:MAG: metal ABC transporter substrate-binding protein [Actinomycetota bacterium]